MVAVRCRIDHDEAAPAGGLFPYKRQPGSGLVVPFDDHILKQIAEACFNGTLVAPIDVEIVGHRALLANVAVGLDQYHPGRVAELGAARSRFLQRRQAGFDGRNLLLLNSEGAHPFFVLGPRARQLRLPGSAVETNLLEGRLRPCQRLGARSVLRVNLLGLELQVDPLGGQLAERLTYPLTLLRAVLDGVPERGNRARGLKLLRSARPRRRLPIPRYAGAPHCGHCQPPSGHGPRRHAPARRRRVA